MKLQLISDLHIDVNKRVPLSLNEQADDVYTLIAGDTSGTPSDAIKWIRKNVKRGIVISGNHICYNNLRRTYQSLRRSFARAFPINNDITYLDATVGVTSKEIGEDVLVVGSTFYTNYKLPMISNESGNQTHNMYNSRRMMNDFRFGIMSKRKVDESQLGVQDLFSHRTFGYEYTYIKPEDYVKWHEQSFKAMSEIIENNPDKKIVVITHHCPSPKCISKQYVDSTLNASYVSDYDKFIIEHPQIKLWHCGHVHHRATFNIGETKIVMNPRGYCRSYEYDPNWTPYYYIDTDTWEITEEPFKCDNSKLAEEKLYGLLFF
jgi:Icc-related predicted phosphoesterase